MHHGELACEPGRRDAALQPYERSPEDSSGLRLKAQGCPGGPAIRLLMIAGLVKEVGPLQSVRNAHGWFRERRSLRALGVCALPEYRGSAGPACRKMFADSFGCLRAAG